MVIGISVTLCLIWLIAIILAFSERARYLTALEQIENKNSITNRINSVSTNISAPTNSVVTKRQDYALKPIDINSVDEEEISALQGLTIIDCIIWGQVRFVKAI